MSDYLQALRVVSAAKAILHTRAKEREYLSCQSYKALLDYLEKAIAEYDQNTKDTPTTAIHASGDAEGLPTDGGTGAATTSPTGSAEERR